MFNINKGLLKNKIKSSVKHNFEPCEETPYVSSHGSIMLNINGYTLCVGNDFFHQIDDLQKNIQLKEQSQKMIDALNIIVDDFVDAIYDTNNFESDLGLR